MMQIAVETLERSQAVPRENGRLRHEQSAARREGRKQQLSPHFLFNPRSTLGSAVAAH